MSRIFPVASREFRVIVFSKAFVFGLLFLPVTVAVVAFVFSRFGDQEFITSGQVAVIDPTDRVYRRMEAALSEGTEAASLAELARQAAVEQFGSDNFEAALAFAPELTLVRRPATADIEEEKRWLWAAPENENRLALIVVHDDAIDAAGGEYGTYDIYVPRSIDNREEIAVHAVVREAIRSLRIEGLGIGREAIESATTLPRVESVTVTEDGEQANAGGFNVMLPAAFIFLLFMGVMGGGQGLLNSMIEEKSSRVVEVLLSAVSPMQLMAGKLLGHMCASMVGMSIYLVAGLFVLGSVSMLGLLEPILILYLFLFFIVTYFLIGSLMLSVGAAVNELSEANSLMTPFMFVLMLPWFLWFPVSRDPDSVVSVVFSFLPPVNAFGMMMRLASTQPPPAWQVWLSLAVSCVSVYGALWFAAKVFRIGLLMYGKPPNFATLIRWARAA